MQQRGIIHFLDASSRIRAEMARVAYGLNYHAEVYADINELTMHDLRPGALLIRDDKKAGGFERLMEKLERHAICLLVVALVERPTLARAVELMKAGAFDVLRLPIEPDKLKQTLQEATKKAESISKDRRKMFDARQRLQSLSKRERQVLDALSVGNSNKAIARNLSISPRTVEIHRANMMIKLGAKHAADAVRVSLEAKI